MSKKTDVRYIQPFYQRQALRFSCTECGGCCYGSDQHHVFLTQADFERITNYLEISAAWFRRRYVQRFEDEWVLRSRPDGGCVFLDHDHRCRIYAQRPLQCATYPFWPELLKTAKAWQQEKRRCEGIDQGVIIPLQRIKQALRQLVEEQDES